MAPPMAQQDFSATGPQATAVTAAAARAAVQPLPQRADSTSAGARSRDGLRADDVTRNAWVITNAADGWWDLG